MQKIIKHLIQNLEIVKIILDKGEIIPPHNHPGKSGFLYMVKGKCKIKHYEIISDDKTNVVFKLVDETTLKKDEQSVLTSKRNNIHSIEALEKSVILDSFAPCGPVSEAVWYKLTAAGKGKYKAKKTPLEAFNIDRMVEEYKH